MALDLKSLFSRRRPRLRPRLRSCPLRPVFALMGLAVLSWTAHPVIHADEFIGDLLGSHAAAHDDCPLHLNGTTPTTPEVALPISIPAPRLDWRLPLPADQVSPRAPELASSASPRAPPEI